MQTDPSRTPSAAAPRTRDLWQLFKVMAEFVDGFTAVETVRDPAVAIFGSARLAAGHPAYELTRECARLLSQAGFTVVTGGGPGLMEAANRGAADVGAPSLGLNIRLPHEQGSNPYATTQVTFDFFPVRKAFYSYVARAIIVAPGGWGTLDELFTIATLRQTGKIAPIPIYLLDSTFWQGALEWIRTTLVPLGTISPADGDGFLVFDDPAALVADLKRRARQVKASDLGRL